MSRSITLNGVKATIIFQDTYCTEKPTIDWELVIESSDNKASIDGSIIMDVQPFDIPTPHTTPIIEPILEPILESIIEPIIEPILEPILEPIIEPILEPILDNPSELDASTQTLIDFKNYVSKSLSEIESRTNNKEKACIASIMFNYMTKTLHLVEQYKEFKHIAIDRAYHLKLDNAEEFPELIQSIDAFLVAVGAPLTQEKYVDECGYTWNAFVGKPDKHKDDNERIILLKKIFQEENFTFKIEYMNWYYTWEETAPRLNRYQKMKLFIRENKKELIDLEDTQKEERKTLMMSIFKKNNLEFKDVYMDMYYEWQKNAPKENRYKKMCSFIQAQGFK